MVRDSHATASATPKDLLARRALPQQLAVHPRTKGEIGRAS
jgi:hypothetical protein